MPLGVVFIESYLVIAKPEERSFRAHPGSTFYFPAQVWWICFDAMRWAQVVSGYSLMVVKSRGEVTGF